MLAHRIISTFQHRAHDVTLGVVGPDLIAEVDGCELGAFYQDAADAHAAVNRHIDYLEKEAKKNGL